MAAIWSTRDVPGIACQNAFRMGIFFPEGVGLFVFHVFLRLHCVCWWIVNRVSTLAMRKHAQADSHGLSSLREVAA